MPKKVGKGKKGKPKKKVEQDKSSSTTTKIGDIQQTIGEYSSDYSLYVSYVSFFIVTILSTALIIFGATTTDDGGWYAIGFGIAIIVLSILNIFWERFINRKVHSNRANAQLYATVKEIGFLGGAANAIFGKGRSKPSASFNFSKNSNKASFSI